MPRDLALFEACWAYFRSLVKAIVLYIRERKWGEIERERERKREEYLLTSRLREKRNARGVKRVASRRVARRLSNASGTRLYFRRPRGLFLRDFDRLRMPPSLWRTLFDVSTPRGSLRFVRVQILRECERALKFHNNDNDDLSKTRIERGKKPRRDFRSRTRTKVTVTIYLEISFNSEKRISSPKQFSLN